MHFNHFPNPQSPGRGDWGWCRYICIEQLLTASESLEPLEVQFTINANRRVFNMFDPFCDADFYFPLLQTFFSAPDSFNLNLFISIFLS